MAIRDEINRARVLSDIETERERQQRAEGWTLEHDSTHSPLEWMGLIVRYLGLAMTAAEAIDETAYRRRMVQVAAIGVAAIESYDRATQDVANDIG